MKVNDYQKLAMTTANPIILNDIRKGLLDGALGLTGEAGEVAEIIKKTEFQGHWLDKNKLKEELGDIMWYIALIATTLDISIEDIMVANINKLKARYPEGFDSNKSIFRK